MFHSNIDIQLHSESIKQRNNSNLLSIHVLTSNKGRVPVDVYNQDNFVLEIKRIENLEENKWLDPSKLKMINKTNLLRTVTGVKKGEALITFEPDSESDQVETIVLPDGTYWIHARLDLGAVNEDGDYFEGIEVIKLPMEK